MISVIMSAYNEKKEWLEIAIESILNQTYSDFEFLITLDNPDNIELENVIKKYSKEDSRIVYIKNKKNIGLTASLNNMLKKAKGEFIARMDADDISLPNRFEKQLKYLKKNNLDLCGTDIVQFYGDTEINEIKNPSKFEGIKEYIYIKNCVAHPTFFAKKIIFDRLNGYNEVPACEDYDFLLRAINSGFAIGNVPEVLLKYRLSPNSVSRKNLGSQVALAEYISNFYRNNKKAMVSMTMIEDYKLSKAYKKAEKKLNRYQFEKNQMLKFKKTNKFLYFNHLAKLFFDFDLLLKNIYENRKMKSILKKDRS